MASAVAGCAADFEFVDDGVLAGFICGVVVVFVQVVASAIDTSAVAFFHDPFLACGGVSLFARGVDRVSFGVVDQYADERVRDELSDL